MLEISCCVMKSLFPRTSNLRDSTVLSRQRLLISAHTKTALCIKHISLGPVVNILAIFSNTDIQKKNKRIKRYHIKGIGKNDQTGTKSKNTLYFCSNSHMILEFIFLKICLVLQVLQFI